MSETLPERPHLDWYRKAAKKRLAALRADDPSATLSAAQLAIARERGFASWRKLKQAVESTLQMWVAAVEAVQRDRPDELARILKLQPGVVKQQSPSNGYSLLHYVAGRLRNEVKPRRLETLRMLLDAGHPIDAPLPVKGVDQGGETALHFAATLEDVPVTDALINAGASVHLNGSGEGGTPLVQGLFYGAIGATERLAQVAITPTNLRTAAGLGRVDLIDALFDSGKPKPAAGASRIFYRPHDEYPTWKPSDDPQEWLDEALIYATKNGRFAAVERMLVLGANVNGMPYDATALHFAAWFGRREIAELLLDRGADLSIHDRQYNGTPEGWAQHGGRPELVALLRQAKPAPASNESVSKLLAFVADGDVDGVRSMLDVTPELVNAVGPHPSWGGRPQALHVAIERNHRAVFDLLLERGADPNGDNAAYDGWSPAMLAVHWKRTDMLAELRRRLGPDDLVVALMSGNDERALELLQSPSALQSPVPNNATLLHFASTLPPAERLLELGVAIDATDKYGKTPLMRASERNRPDLVAFLISRGATPSLEMSARLGQLDRLKKQLADQKPGDDLIVAAVEAKQAGVVRWLLKQGANPNARSAKGSKATLLHSAAWNGDLLTAKLLVAAGADVNAVDEEHKTTPLAWAQTAIRFVGNTDCQTVITYLEGIMPASPATVDTFLNLAVSPHRDDRKDNWKKAAAMLKKDPAIADASIYTAAVTGRSATIAKLLKVDKSMATAVGGPRGWQPLSYLAFSRFVRFDAKRERDFLKSAKLLLNAGADPNTYWQEKADDPNSVKESVLYGAAGVNNNTALTRLLLQAGANPDDHGPKPSDVEALYHAAEFKNNDVLKLLRDHGASDKWWSYCLLRKLDYDDYAGAKYMLDRGADPNHLHPGSGRAAMHWAIKNGRSLKFVKAIREAGGDPNLAGKDGLTPYTLARRLGRTDVAEYLLKHGANDDRGESDRFVDLLAAGDVKAAKAMLKKSPKLVKQLTPLQLRALPDAAAARNLPAVKAMLDVGFPVDTPGNWGGSALHHAAWEDQPQMVKLLLKRGARVDVRQQWDGDAMHTLLHCANVGQPKHAAECLRAMVQSGQVKDISKYLPENPEDPGSQKVIKLLTPFLSKHSDDPAVKALPAHRKGHKIAQWKPIMDAAYTGDADRIRKLLAEGADPNAVSTTPARYRPLHRAIERKKSFKRGPKDIEAVKALLKGGADPTLRGGWSKETALQMAATYEPLFVPVLVEYFQPLDIFHACAVGDEQRVAALLKQDKSLAKARDQDQWTPLHFAAASRMHEVGKSQALLDIARMLLKAGADVMAAWNFNDEWPLRPLYYAAGWSNHPAMVELLLLNGADACDSESTYHAADEGYAGCLAMIEKYTPAKKLARECTSCLVTQLHWGRTRGAKWLLEHGADPNWVSDRYGKTAMQVAAEKGASEGVIALLLKHGGDRKAGLEAAKAARKTRVVEQLS